MATGTQTAPPLMHFALATLYAEAGYAIRRAIWDGAVGGHAVAWLRILNGIWYYSDATGTRIVRGTHVASSVTVQGDVMAADLRAFDWTLLAPGCDLSSSCVCGDRLLMAGVLGFPDSIQSSGEPTLNLDDPNSVFGINRCELPPSDYSARFLTVEECDCYTPFTQPGLGPQPDPVPADSGGGASPRTPDGESPTPTVIPGGAGGTTEAERSTGGGGAGGGGAGGGSGTGSPGPGGPGGGPGGSPTGGPGGSPGGGPGGGGPPPGPGPDPGPDPGPGGPSVTITTTRTNDAPVECVLISGSTTTTCPDVAPNDYQWIGSVTLSAPDSGNAWSTTIRRTGLDGGIIVWTGNLSDGGTHDFGPVAFAAGTAPGANFQFQVTCNELLGDGTCSDSVTVNVPNCEACDAIVCEDPLNLGNQIVCPEGYTLNALDCFCYEDDTCPSGQIFDPALGYCREDCESPFVYNPGSGTCECPPGFEWNGSACQACDEAGTLLSTGPCEGGFEILTYADGECGEYTNPVEC